jgi:two-component system sensor kinase FixL
MLSTVSPPPMLNPDSHATGILTAIADSSEDAIFVTNLEGVVLTWNRAAADLYGYAFDEIAGRTVSALMPEGHRGELQAFLQQIQAGHRITRLEAVGRTKRGRMVDVRLSASAVQDPRGEVLGAAFVVHDVTRHKQEERAQRSTELRWRSIIESAVDGIVVIDSHGRIEAFNPAAERLFGYAESEVLGANVSMLMPAPYRDEHDGYLARYLREGDARIIGIGRDVQGLRRDGTVFSLHLSVGEMSVEGQRKFTGILHDLSARVRLEEQLREQASLAKLGEMAAVIAHEIRNPLAGIRGAIQIIGGRLPQEGQDVRIIGEIVNRIDSLGGLMRDLLLFARPPQPRLAPTEIQPLVARTVDLLSADPALQGVRVDIGGAALPVMADAELLKIVFHNLLVNGAHAMQGAGRIRVTVTEVGPSCNVAFLDSGPGIPPAIREKVFVPFFTTKSRGTGLGLPTVKRIVDAHRGQILLDCPPAGGTLVTVCLPTARS